MKRSPIPDLEPVFSTRDVAKMFGVTPVTIRNWADEGRLDGFKHPGGHWRFRLSAVKALLAESRQEG